VPNHESIAELGENLSLKRVIARLRKPAEGSEAVVVGPGDDSAVLAAPDGRFCVTTDTMVEGHDFKLEWSTAFDLGWKAVATNVSDVAAMGAKPTSLVIAMGVPAQTEVRWLEEFVDGANAACEALAPSCFVVGGDLAASASIFIAVTAFGDLEGREPVLRSGARPGDIVAVGGTLGRAACGLALLQSQNQDAIKTWDDWVNTQRRPEPPVALGVAAAEAGATSMLDLSDGLARDAARVAKASQVSIALSRQALQAMRPCLRVPPVGSAQTLLRGFWAGAKTIHCWPRLPPTPLCRAGSSASVRLSSARPTSTCCSTQPLSPNSAGTQSQVNSCAKGACCV